MSASSDSRTEILNTAELDALRQFSTPTIANAIETFQVRPPLEGVTSPAIRCLFPRLGVLVGYACTAVINSSQPPALPRKISRRDYWEHIRKFGGPRLSVVEDLAPAPQGAYWGEINANMHLALGSRGVITNGTVRALSEVERAGFHFFASGVQVSHGYAHLEDYGITVAVFGMTVKPGDLIHADQHGAVVIPHEIAREVAPAARAIELREQAMLAACALENPIDELDRLISPEY
ncbi:MAG: RraA family protein [Acidobacteriaceae bacterium]|nr:RraA family protein [Acidobacteriaceae bacterium]